MEHSKEGLINFSSYLKNSEYVKNNLQLIPKKNLIKIILEKEDISKTIKLREPRRQDSLVAFKEQYEKFIGKNSRIVRSEFERDVEKKLEE